VTHPFLLFLMVAIGRLSCITASGRCLLVELQQGCNTVPLSDSVQGIICATVLMVVIALANVYTNDILLWQAHAVRRKDYETLSEVRRQLYFSFVCHSLTHIHQPQAS
jgi:hypothetical protein